MKLAFLQKQTLLILSSVASVCMLVLSGCEIIDPQAEQIAANTQIQLVDWHISGLWVINSPVAWVRVTNMNDVPIHEINFEYEAFAADGRTLNKGDFTIEGTVPPHTTKNFIELYLGLVDLYTERLSIKLKHVRRAD